ncbi:MAG: tetratricopeptide repeat protein [Chloroflexi bacterium]|nr:tetratricopeptide repeat protein [Chloroflexota bacterium]
MKKVMIVLVILILLGLGIYYFTAPRPFNIIYTNNLQGRILQDQINSTYPAGNIEDVAAVISGLKADFDKKGEDYIIVDGGDTLTGQQDISGVLAGKPVYDILKSLGYNAILLRENEYGLGKKLEDLKEGPVQLGVGVMDSQGKPVKVTPEAGVKAGRSGISILGLFMPDLNPMDQKNRVKIAGHDFNQSLEAFKKALESAGGKFKLLLYYESSSKWLSEVKGIDLVIPSHYVDEAGPERQSLAGAKPQENSFELKKIGEVTVAPFVDSRFNVGVIHVNPRGIGKWEYEARIIPVGGKTDVPSAVKDVIGSAQKEFKDKTEAPDNYLSIQNEILCYGKEGFLNTPAAGKKFGETITSNYIADLMQEKTGVDIAVLDVNSVKGDLQGLQGIEDLSRVLPGWTELVTLELDGKKLKALLQQNSKEDKDFLTISGAVIAYSPGQAGSLLMLYNGRPINDKDNFRIVTTAYLADKKSDPPILSAGKNRVNTGILLNYVLFDAMAAGYYLEMPPYRVYGDKRQVLALADTYLKQGLEEYKNPPTSKKGVETLILAASLALHSAKVVNDIRKDLKPPLFQYVMGRAYMRLGMWPEAAEEFKAAVKLAPKDPLYNFMLGDLSYMVGAYHEAVGYCDSSIKIKQNQPAAWFMQGVSYLNEGRSPSAVGSLQKSIGLDNGNLAGHLMLGRAYMGEGKLKFARSAFKAAASIAPGNEKVIKLSNSLAP